MRESPWPKTSCDRCDSRTRHPGSQYCATCIVNDPYMYGYWIGNNNRTDVSAPSETPFEEDAISREMYEMGWQDGNGDGSFGSL